MWLFLFAVTSKSKGNRWLPHLKIDESQAHIEGATKTLFFLY